LIEPLTRREVEVLRLLQARRTNDEIARVLYVSVDTVKKHTKNLYQKLQVGGRHHAVAQAVALGLLPPAPAATRKSSSGPMADLNSCNYNL
jgi:LuxR family transcriptional regulator, maltose regulon positive regulatory protein